MVKADLVHIARRSTAAFAALLGTVLLWAVLAAPQAKAAFEPRSFDVQVDMSPALQSNDPVCSDAGGGSSSCVKSLDSDRAPKRSLGTVKDLSSDDSGKFELNCTNIQTGSVTYLASGGVITGITAVEGTRYQACSWLMNFRSGSSLVGTVEGHFELGSSTCRGEPAISATGPLEAHAIAGTGRFEGLIGKAPIEKGDEPFTYEPLSGAASCDPGDVPPPAHPSALSAMNAISSAAQGAGWKFKVRKGRPAIRILTPPRMVTTAQTVAVRVATPRRSRCSARASRGGKKKSLGRATDRDGNGELAFRGSVSKKLGAGTWKLRVSCKYKSRGKTRSSRSKRTFTIS